MEKGLMTRQDVSVAPIEDVAKFLIIAPEKARAMQAEIRAIKKLGMAKEIYEQKQDELRMVNELVLDAKVRMGELTMLLPKASGGNHGNQYVPAKNISGNNLGKPKKQVVEEFGFSTDQVSQMERLAKNQDLVEQEKEAAKKEDRMPYAKNVLRMIADRNNEQESQRQYKNGREFMAKLREIDDKMSGGAEVIYSFDDVVAEIIVIGDETVQKISRVLDVRREVITNKKEIRKQLKTLSKRISQLQEEI